MKKLAAALLAAPALAAEDTAPAPQMPDAWAVGELADSYAMGLVDDNYTTYIQSTITSEQLSAMTGIVADKLALLELPQRAADTEGLVVDTTRGGVLVGRPSWLASLGVDVPSSLLDAVREAEASGASAVVAALAPNLGGGRGLPHRPGRGQGRSGRRTERGPALHLSGGHGYGRAADPGPL